MRRLGKPDPGMMANGMLAGLVAITAPCAFVSPQASAIIGAIAGVLVIESILFIENKLKIDDPVGAISVHGVCGTFGVLAVGLFANGTYGAGWNLTTSGDVVDAGVGIIGILPLGDAEPGFFNFGLGGGQLVAQAIGAATIWIVMGRIVYLWFRLSKHDHPDPFEGRGRNRRPRSWGDGCARLPRVHPSGSRDLNLIRDQDLSQSDLNRRKGRTRFGRVRPLLSLALNRYVLIGASD